MRTFAIALLLAAIACRPARAESLSDTETEHRLKLQLKQQWEAERAQEAAHDQQERIRKANRKRSGGIALVVMGAVIAAAGAGVIVAGALSEATWSKWVGFVGGLVLGGPVAVPMIVKGEEFMSEAKLIQSGYAPFSGF